jgi:WD40 repeat protein
VIETGNRRAVFSVAFHSDGMQLLSGTGDVLRRWRVADGQEVANQMANRTSSISVSRDGKWIVCGGVKGASVWDVKTQEKAFEVEGTVYVGAVDISPESTRFAAGTGGSDNKASIWNIITGERLVGPLQHDGYIAGIKFSPNGDHIATLARGQSIRVFDSRNGDQLIAIKTDISSRSPMTPLAWSDNGEQIFIASSDHKIKSFDVSTGSQLAEFQVHGDDEVMSIALAANGKFLATSAERSISFCDTSTLTQIGPVIEDSQKIRSIALSPDCSYLATGGSNGNITIRNLNNILPDLYGPFRVSIYACTILSDKSHILSLRLESH